MNEETEPRKEDAATPIECRAAVQLSPTATNEVLFLPIGLHAITPVAGGIGRPIKVKINADAAAMMERQRSGLAAKGKRPYFDFNHEDGPASFWPDAFIWRNGEGVIACGEWSRRGRAAVEGKDYRAFSPVFHVDNKRGDPATVICKDLADPNMGGLVNNPAFKDLPLWAKNAGAPALQQQQERQNKMNADELAALRAKHRELQQEVARLSASGAEPEAITAKQTESQATEFQIEAEELKASNASLETKIRKRQQEDAHAAVRAAVKRGAILARDLKSQQQWETWVSADPSKMEILNALQGPNQSIIGGGSVTSANNTWSGNSRVTITSEDPTAIFSKMAQLGACNIRSTKRDERLELSKNFAAIYAAEIHPGVTTEGKCLPGNERILSMSLPQLGEALMAADVTDANLGTLAGTLVTQRTLELLKFTFPALTMFTTDFTNESATYNQTVISRTVDIPSMVVYDPSTGWPASTTATHDVPVTIDHHEGTQINFNEQTMASTVRRLFDEQAPAASYAVAKRLLDTIYARITDANFTNNSVVATSSFARTSVIDIGTALTLRGVPLALGQRTLLLYPTVFGKLVGDTALITFAAYQKPELITNPQNGASLVIPVDTFNVVNAPNLPTNNGNVTGFAGSKSALVIATRMPNDYTAQLPGASFGSVQTVTDPDLGLSVMLTQYVNHQLATGNSRISLMWGTAAGQTAAGQLLKAASGSGSSRT